MEHIQPNRNQENHPIKLEGLPGVDLRALRPPELVALWQDLWRDDSDNGPLDYENDERGKLYSELGRAFPTIPEQDPEYGYVLASEFASQPDPFFRYNAATMLPSLTRVNHDAGLDLWSKLIRDADRENRVGALECTKIAKVPREPDLIIKRASLWQEDEILFEPEQYANAATIFAAQGLTPQDAQYLHGLFLGASNGEIELYDPAADLVKRLRGES